MNKIRQIWYIRYLSRKRLRVSNKLAIAEHYQIHYRIVVPLEPATWYVFSKLWTPFDSNSDKPLVYVWVYYCFSVSCIGTMYYFTYRYRSIMYEMENVTFVILRIFFNILANKYYPFDYSKDQRYLFIGREDKRKDNIVQLTKSNCLKLPNKSYKIDHVS